MARNLDVGLLCAGGGRDAVAKSWKHGMGVALMVWMERADGRQVAEMTYDSISTVFVEVNYSDCVQI